MRVQLREQRSNANFLLGERFNRAVYGDHPAANVSATRGISRRLTQDALGQWHRERYAPQNSILGIAGDVRAKDCNRQIRKAPRRLEKERAAADLAPQSRRPPARAKYTSSTVLTPCKQRFPWVTSPSTGAVRTIMPMVVMNISSAAARRRVCFSTCARRKATPTEFTATLPRCATPDPGAPAATCAPKSPRAR